LHRLSHRAAPGNGVIDQRRVVEAARRSASIADTTTCTLDVTGNHGILIRDNTGTLTCNHTIELDKL
jgi:hypothetical protein